MAGLAELVPAPVFKTGRDGSRGYVRWVRFPWPAATFRHQLLARNDNDCGDRDQFISLLAETPPVYLRDLIRFRDVEPIDISEVAPVEGVVATTLRGAAMSHGALHSTAHRARATGGEIFIAGGVGQRLGVRNSGAVLI